MMWIVSLAMFWVGGSIGFILGAWWVAAHAHQRKMDQYDRDDEAPEATK